MMPPADLRALIAQVGLTTTSLARYLGTNDRTVRRWVSDDEGTQTVPPAVSLVLRYCAVTGMSPAAFRSIADKWKPPA